MSKIGTTNSKYIGQIYDGWLVDWAEQVKGGHTRFYLSKTLANSTTGTKYVITVRDNELTKLSRGEKTMDQLLIAKAKMAQRGVYAYHNTIQVYTH